jgi:hypothetical protein
MAYRSLKVVEVAVRSEKSAAVILPVVVMIVAAIAAVVVVVMVVAVVDVTAAGGAAAGVVAGADEAGRDTDTTVAGFANAGSGSCCSMGAVVVVGPLAGAAPCFVVLSKVIGDIAVELARGSPDAEVVEVLARQAFVSQDLQQRRPQQRHAPVSGAKDERARQRATRRRGKARWGL